MWFVNVKCSFPLGTVWTCTFIYAQEVSSFSLAHVWSMYDHDLKHGSLFPTYTAMWTCAFTSAQRVSYFLLHILCMIMILNVISFHWLATIYVNLDIDAQVVSYFWLLHVMLSFYVRSQIESFVFPLATVWSCPLIYLLSRKSAHGWDTLQACQRRGWVLF